MLLQSCIFVSITDIVIMACPDTNTAVFNDVFDIRIVHADFYMSKPERHFDDISQLTHKGTKIPIIRLFGVTPSGQKGCVHVHDCYPYFYVELPSARVPSETDLSHMMDVIDNLMFRANASKPVSTCI